MQNEIIDYFTEKGINIYVRWYEDLYIMMIVLALILSVYLAAKRGLPVVKFYLATLLIFFIAFLGGRIYAELFLVDQPVLSFFHRIIYGKRTESVGVYVSGITGAFVILKLMKIDRLKAFGIYAPVLALSLAIGRIGCFMGGCCYGRICSLPWGVKFPKNSPVYFSQLKAGMINVGYDHSLPVHPTQIYEALFGLVLFIWLIYIDHRKRSEGFYLFIYLISYAVFRFFIEFLRGDDRGNFLGLSYPQIFAILLFIFAITAIVNIKLRVKQDTLTEHFGSN